MVINAKREDRWCPVLFPEKAQWKAILIILYLRKFLKKPV